jgi:tetratricopeptide (TPR) repeat protein/CHAT domain-containing protein
MKDPQEERQSHPWPFWMLRYIASGDREAFNDLIWSVGGSPPYGNVSYNEASAVYDLLEEYRGPGTAPAAAYEAVQKYIGGNTERMQALELFRIHDRIASNADDYTDEDVSDGLELATAVGHSGMRAYFLNLQGSTHNKRQDIPAAKAAFLNSLSLFLTAWAEDQAYADRVMTDFQNAIILCVADGDFARAHELLVTAEARLPASVTQHWRKYVGEKPADGLDAAAVLDRAGNYLEGNKLGSALQWYQAAERLARSRQDEPMLCDLLGDMAVIFRHLNNPQRAIETYQEAIALSEKRRDWENLSRWNQNLGLIYRDRQNADLARLHFRQGMDAAIESRLPYQIANALGNLAAYLQDVKRFAEAIESIDRAMTTLLDDPELHQIWRTNKVLINYQWGDQLHEEGQITAAIDTYAKVVQEADRSDKAQLRLASQAAAKMGALYETQNDIGNTITALKQAEDLFRTQGDRQAADRLGALVSQVQAKSPATLASKAAQDDIEKLRYDITQAIASRNREAELTARVNLATMLLNVDDPQTEAAFEEALTMVRARQDRRRELILNLNFTGHFLALGQVRRALNMANRSVELVTDEQPDRKVLAYLLLCEVLADGLGDPDRASSAYRVVIAELNSYRQTNPEAAGKLTAELSQQLAKAAKAALNANDTQAALELLDLVEPELGAKIRREHQASVDRVANTVDVEALRVMSDPNLDPILAAWRAARGGVAPDQPVQNQVIEGIHEFATIVNWPDAAARLSRASIPADYQGSSQGGPAGVLRVAIDVRNGEVSREAAEQALHSLSVPDDDLLCLCLYALQDQAMAPSGAALLLVELVVKIIASPVLKGRLYNLLGMLTAHNPTYALSYYQRGADSLAGGEDNQLRAQLLNEVAVSLSNLRRFEQAIESARKAESLAEAVGVEHIAAMATGNIALSLMNLGHWEEALTMFQSLAARQEVSGDTAGLAITEHNINTCYIHLGRTEQVVFDETSTDPDVLFNQASYLGVEGKYDQSIALFKRGFACIEADKQPYQHEGSVRQNYARVLYSAGQHSQAIEEMLAAAKWYERREDTEGLRAAYAWLTGASLNDRQGRSYYAERAVALSRQVAAPDDLASDLGHLAHVRVEEGKLDEAIALIHEARQLSDLVDVRLELASTLADARRFDSAMELYDELYSRAERDNDERTKMAALLGRGDVYVQRLEYDQAIVTYRDARMVALALKPDNLHVYLANQYGLVLLRTNAITEAAHSFEEGIDLARTLGLAGQELGLLNNLSSALMETGNLKGAEETLKHVLERSRDNGGKQHELVALGILANVVVRNGEYTQALQLYQEGAAIAVEVGDREVEAVMLDSIGTTYSRLEQPARAVEYHGRAARIHKELGRWESQATDLLNLMGAYLALDEPQNAEPVLAAAVEIINAHDLAYLEVSVQRGRGEIALRAQRWDDAKRHFLDAMRDLEKIRGTLRTATQERQWAEDKTAIYTRAAEAAILAGDGETAIECIEANKTRFLRTLSERRAQRPAGVDEAVWLRYRQAQDRQVDLQARRWASLAAPDPELETALRQAHQEYAQARSILEANTAFTDDIQSADLLSVGEIVEALPVGTVAVSIDTYPSGLGIVSIGRTIDGKLYSHTQMEDAFTRADLVDLLVGDREGLRKAIKTGQIETFPAESVGWMLGSYVYGQDPIWIDTMSRVYGMEIQAASHLWPSTISAVCRVLSERVWPAIMQTLPEDTRHLILMPSAGFALLPLHAATLPDNEPIYRRFCISYVPSLGLLHQIGQHDTLPVEARLGQVINPTQDLLFSPLEAVDFARSFRGEHEQIVGSDVSIANVLLLLSKSDVFHFIGHAFYDRQDPFNSGLVCASDRERPSVLTLRTILEDLTTIRSKLVILSACETAQVESQDALNDFLGLPGGFIVSGANAVLASLWRAEDLATALLIGKFSQLWNDSTTPQTGAVALANAQDWLRTVTAGELAAHFEAEQRKSESEREFSYEQISAAWQRFTFDFDLSDRPFEKAMYWAAFTFTGVSSSATLTE